MSLASEFYSFPLQLIEPSIQNMLFQFKIGDAIAQKSAGSIGLFENHNFMAGAIQLLGGRQSGRPGADNGDLFAGPVFWRERLNPGLMECALHGVVFDRSDVDRL